MSVSMYRSLGRDKPLSFALHPNCILWSFALHPFINPIPKLANFVAQGQPSLIISLNNFSPVQNKIRLAREQKTPLNAVSIEPRIVKQRLID